MYQLQAHIVDDTHALRMLDTRLGTSFNCVLILALLGLFVLVFGAANLRESSSLVPAPMNSTSIRMDSYGQLNITVHFFAPRTLLSLGCDKSIEKILSPSLGCVATAQGDVTKVDDSTPLMFCRVDINCSTGLNIRGTQHVTLGLPDKFQVMQWTVVGEQWDMTKDFDGEPSNPTHLLSHVLGPSKGLILDGTRANPTALNFGVIRSVLNDMRYEPDQGGCMTGGLRMSWRDASRVQSTEGSVDSKHYVSFRFIVEENLYRKVLEFKMDTMTQLGLVITYCLSVIAVLGPIKSSLQMMIDAICIKSAEKKGKDPPKDVLRRINVLEERVQPNSTTEAGDIEMTDPFGRDERTITEMENPLSKNKVHKRRRSSAPSAFAPPPPAPVRRSSEVNQNLQLEKRLQDLEAIVKKYGMKSSTVSESQQHDSGSEETQILTDQEGRRYSFNNKTSESDTARLAGLAALKSSTASESQQQDSGSEETQILTDEEGRKYSFNKKTGESKWLD